MTIRALLLISFVSLCPQSITAQPLDSLRHLLEGINDTGLSYRRHVMKTIQKYGASSSQMDSLNNLIIHFDKESLVTVTAIIEKYGWLGKSQVGYNGNKAIFFTIQHSEIKYMDKYLPLLKKSARQGESDKGDVALMIDRIRVSYNKPQLYGTQYTYNEKEGKYNIYPIKDIKHVNKRRKSVGLNPLEESFEAGNYTILQKY